MRDEEFSVLFPETESKAAIDVAERLRDAIANVCLPTEGELPLNFIISIGVASLRSDSDNIDDLLIHADKALYGAKNSGRNKICVEL